MNFFRNFPKVGYDFFNRGLPYKIQDFTRYATVDTSRIDNLAIYQYYVIENGDRPDVVSTKLYGSSSYHWTFFLINDSLKNGSVAWPMQWSEWEDYMESEYDGTELRFGRVINNLGELLQVGATVTSSSGGSATIHAFNVQHNQVIIKDITGTFDLGDMVYIEGQQLTTGSIVSNTEYRYGLHHCEDVDGNEYYCTSLFADSPPVGGIVEVTFDEYERQLNDDRSRIRVIKPEHIYEFANQYLDTINS